MKPIDLNADVGESPERIEADLALVSVVTSANIACGGHAGDASSMERLVRVCLATGCSIGAHPSYPDRAGFGRSDMAIGLSEIHRHVADQVASLARIAESLGANVGHVKPHGALYHAAAGRVEVADVLADAVMMVVPEAAMIGPCGSPGAARWRARGLAVVEECFADRAYEADGTLTPRSEAGAVITDPARAAARAWRMAMHGVVESRDGVTIPMRPGTLCVHSDTPGAMEIARAVRLAIESMGIRVAAPFASPRA